MQQMPIQYKAKPWGREIWFANMFGYVGKVLEVKAGKRLSLQYHEEKAETIFVMSGKIKLTIGPDQDHLEEIILNPGEKYDIHPKVIHRFEAVEGSQIFEVSTNQLDDVVRLQDDYNRPEKGRHDDLDEKLSQEHNN